MTSPAIAATTAAVVIGGLWICAKTNWNLKLLSAIMWTSTGSIVVFGGLIVLSKCSG